MIFHENNNTKLKNIYDMVHLFLVIFNFKITNIENIY